MNPLGFEPELPPEIIGLLVLQTGHSRHLGYLRLLLSAPVIGLLDSGTRPRRQGRLALRGQFLIFGPSLLLVGQAQIEDISIAKRVANVGAVHVPVDMLSRKGGYLEEVVVGHSADVTVLVCGLGYQLG